MPIRGGKILLFFGGQPGARAATAAEERITKPTTDAHSGVRGVVLHAISAGILLLVAATSASSDSPREPVIHPLENANFASASDLTCLSTAVEAGNPSTRPSAVLVKMEKGCMASWHFHTAAEELIVIKGERKVEISSMPPEILGPGGYAQVPSNEKHQYACSAKGECLWFVRIDRAFDSKAAQPAN
jgi:quercetin dioxygenase-like cupin family protein